MNKACTRSDEERDKPIGSGGSLSNYLAFFWVRPGDRTVMGVYPGSLMVVCYVIVLGGRRLSEGTLPREHLHGPESGPSTMEDGQC